MYPEKGRELLRRPKEQRFASRPELERCPHLTSHDRFTFLQWLGARPPPEEFHYAFTNTLTAEDSKSAYDRYAIAAPGNWVWAYGLIANFKPGHQETWVDYHADRAPLLFIAGGSDHIMPPSVNRSNAKHDKKSPALTEYHEFEGRDHWTCAAPGWEAVADYALTWAQKNASARHLDPAQA